MASPAIPDEAISGSNPSTDNIKDLLSIDKGLAEILREASYAIKELTNGSKDSAEGLEDAQTAPSRSVETAKRGFEEHTSKYFTMIQSLSERLHQQVSALEHAGIIPAEAQSTESQPAPVPSQSVGRTGGAPVKAEPPMQITNGGLGNLDVGWLNSRKDIAAKQKEAELWAEARTHLEKHYRPANELASSDKMDIDESESTHDLQDAETKDSVEDRV